MKRKEIVASVLLYFFNFLDETKTIAPALSGVIHLPLFLVLEIFCSYIRCRRYLD